MAQLFIHLAFSKIQSLDELTASLIDIRKIQPQDLVQIQIDFDVSSVHCDYLMLIVAYVKSLELAGCQCAVHFPNLVHNSAPVQHAAQIGFFEHLGISLPETKGVKHCTCLCTSIDTYIDSSSAMTANRQITDSISTNTSINPSVAVLVNYCLAELMDNVITHSQSQVGGYIVSQYSPFKGELRLLVCDTGLGMFGHLSDAETITLKEAKAAQGRGLSQTTRFVTANKGELIIHSGSNSINVIDGKTTIKRSNYWQGSYIFMRVKTEHLVDYKEILGEDALLFDNVQNASPFTSNQEESKGRVYAFA